MTFTSHLKKYVQLFSSICICFLLVVFCVGLFTGLLSIIRNQFIQHHLYFITFQYGVEYINSLLFSRETLIFLSILYIAGVIKLLEPEKYLRNLIQSGSNKHMLYPLLFLVLFLSLYSLHNLVILLFISYKQMFFNIWLWGLFTVLILYYLLEARFIIRVCRWWVTLRSIRFISVSIVVLVVLFNGLNVMFTHLQASDRPNVILISIDTLRADRLGCFGNNLAPSPFIDRLSKKGVSFSNCFSCIPVTTPSFASLFTSLYPYRHGVIDNNFRGYFLKENHLTLAEVLKNEGYLTAAFISGWTMSRDSNLNQGFDIYDDNLAIKSRTAEELNEIVYDWLIRIGSKRNFFLFLHYFDPHGPYHAPETVPRFCGDQWETDCDLNRIPFYQRQNGNCDPAFYISEYDREIRYTDRQIMILFRRLAAEVDNDTIIILTSDHGESFTEHEWWFDHGGFVYDVQLHVPLIVLSSGELNNAGLRTELVQLIDIFPTLLDMMGLRTFSFFQGKTLGNQGSPVANNNRVIFGESCKGSSERLPGIVEGIAGKQYCLRTDQWKLVRTMTTSGEEFALFDLTSDPGETKNQFDSSLHRNTSQFEQLEAFVQTNYNSPAFQEALIKQDPTSQLDENMTKELRTLGYLD